MLTLARVYGPGVVFHQRAPSGYHLLRRGDESVRDLMTCGFVTFTGGMPTVCARASVTDEARDLISAAGLPWIDHPLVYDRAAEIPALLRDCGIRGQRVSFQNAQPPDPGMDALYWIPREVLEQLNDKAELTRFAPPEHCPQRRVMPTAEAAALPFIPGSPVVIKGSTPMSTGSGGAVLIARTEEQLRGLGSYLAGCTRVVVEEYLSFTRSFCLNFAADHAGTLHYLGSADQVVNSAGVYMGGWIGPELTPPPHAIDIGYDIMRRAMKLGYVGYAGFDFGLLDNGRVVVFDLNFRSCASTPALLWFPELQRRFGADCHVRIMGLARAGTFQDFCRALRPLVLEGHYFPLGAFDPSRSEWTSRAPAAKGLVAGRNRAETEARCEALVAMGFATTAAPWRPG